ncbi:MAG: FHA domain-containing protein [Candidatus Brocadiia bacterium]
MAARQPVLIMIQGPKPGSFWKLSRNRVTTIGRSSRNTIRLTNPSVSRFHCELALVNGRWVVTDLNSKKGTVVNGEKIPHRRVLTPGDTVRLTSVVFRFDMLDEDVRRSSPLLAIREAELDSRLEVKEEPVASLDDIRLRTRLATRSSEEGAAPPMRAFRENVAFLVAVALVVGVLCGGVLLYAHGVLAPRRSLLAGAEPDVQALYRQGVKEIEAGELRPGVAQLRRVEREHPDTRVARMARQQIESALWSALEQGLSELTEAETAGDFARALSLVEGLRELPLPEDALILLSNREQYMRRLARAELEAVRRQADYLLDEGRREQAVRLLERANQRIGLPELADRAARLADEVRGSS